MNSNQSEINNQTIISMKKAKSLMETIIKMVEEDRYCVDIMQQNLAAIGLLKKASEKLMHKHLKTCFVKGVKTGSKAKQDHLIEEIESVMRMGSK
ncbi:metal-sensitive transcriptional regulator [Patescibacteria group bacterium]